MRHAKMREISARVFFRNISKSQDSMIYAIFSFFRIHIPKRDSLPMLFSHLTRPPVMDHRLSNWFVFQHFSLHRSSNWFVFQYFSVHRLSNWFVFLYFSVQNWVKLVRVPVSLSSKLNQNGSCSSISQFKTDQNASVFRYFHSSNEFRRDFHIK